MELNYVFHLAKYKYLVKKSHILLASHLEACLSLLKNLKAQTHTQYNLDNNFLLLKAKMILSWFPRYEIILIVKEYIQLIW